MKIRVERDTLADAISWVARTLPPRPPVPVLGGILLDSTDNGADSGDGDGAAHTDGLTVSGYDYEVSARARVDATVAAPGRVLVSGRLLADITKALPPHPVEFFVDGSRVTISCGSARFSLPTMPVDDYPELPKLPGLVGEVPGEVFGDAVAAVAVAAGKDDTLPMLTGIQVEIVGDKLTLVATDRFRLAMREVDWRPIDIGAQDAAVLVPARTVADAAKTLGNAGTTVSLSLASGEGLLGLAGAGRHTTTRLLDADFPKYRQLLPTEFDVAATVDVANLVEAIKRVSLVAERGSQVRLEFAENGLRLTAGGDDEGSAEEELPVELTGDGVTIAFNPGYLIDGLTAVHSEKARLEFTTANRPALIKPVNADGDIVDGCLHLLMPVRLPAVAGVSSHRQDDIRRVNP